jgi:hypothetical protein
MQFILLLKFVLIPKSCEDPLNWWKANQVRFPTTRQMVHQVFGIINN